MPEVIVYAAVGRTTAQKKALLKDITQAVVKNFELPASSVCVQIIEVPLENKAKGGIAFDER